MSALTRSILINWQTIVSPHFTWVQSKEPIAPFFQDKGIGPAVRDSDQRFYLRSKLKLLKASFLLFLTSLSEVSCAKS
jgi:hypothetical protein